jgi:hypothetical protein
MPSRESNAPKTGNLLWLIDMNITSADPILVYMTVKRCCRRAAACKQCQASSMLLYTCSSDVQSATLSCRRQIPRPEAAQCQNLRAESRAHCNMCAQWPLGPQKNAQSMFQLSLVR